MKHLEILAGTGVGGGVGAYLSADLIADVHTLILAGLCAAFGAFVAWFVKRLLNKINS